MFRSIRLRAGLSGVAALLLFVVACGGGSSSDISDSDAVDATNEYLATTLGLFTGTTDAQTFVDQYAPECREGVDVSALAFVSAFMQALAPDLAGVEIEAVDVGKLKVEKADDGVLVTPEEPDALRLKVDGEFVAANDFFGEAGFVPSDEEDGIVEPLNLVKRDGKIYIANCDELKDLAGGIGGS